MEPEDHRRSLVRAVGRHAMKQSCWQLWHHVTHLPLVAPLQKAIGFARRRHLLSLNSLLLSYSSLQPLHFDTLKQINV